MSYEEQDTEFVEYVHPSRLFSISYPVGWNVNELRVQDGIGIAFSCTEPPVLVQLTLAPAPVDDSDAAMEEMIRQVVHQQAGYQPQFTLDTSEIQPDDSIWASYTYGAGGSTTVGDALIWVDEPLVIDLIVEQAERNVDITQPLIDDMIDSLAIDTANPLP